MVDRKNEPPFPERVQFHYIKSRFFRVIHVDGAIGTVTPNGHIHCAIYSERPAIPQASEHDVSPEGGLSEGVPTGKEGIVREMDVDLIMNRRSAINLRDWLSRQIEQLEKLAVSSDAEGGNDA